jgi:hypothetical protein
MINIDTGVIDVKQHIVKIDKDLTRANILNVIYKDYPDIKVADTTSYELNGVFHKIIALYKIKAENNNYNEFYIVERFDGDRTILTLRNLKSIIQSDKAQHIINLKTKSKLGFSGTITGKQYSSNRADNVNVIFDYRDELAAYVPTTPSMVFYLLASKELKLPAGSYTSQYSALYSKLEDAAVNTKLTAEQLEGTYSKLKLLGVKCIQSEVNTLFVYDRNDNAVFYTMQQEIGQW